MKKIELSARASLQHNIGKQNERGFLLRILIAALPPGASAPDRRGAGSAGLTVIKLIAFFFTRHCLFITSIKAEQFYGLLSRDQLIKCKKWLFKVWFWIRLGSPLYKFCVFQRKLSDSPKSIGKKLAFKTFLIAAKR